MRNPYKNVLLATWNTYTADLPVEKRQLIEEGKDLGLYEAVLDAVAALPNGADKENLGDALFPALMALPRRKDYPYDEPSDPESIRAKRPAAPKLGEVPTDAVLLDKFHAAWLGRVCGCLLGKPVEGMRTPKLHAMLQKQDNFPLNRYIRYDPEYFAADRPGLIDRLPDYAPSDDDTNYTVMAALCIVEKYGRDFTPANVADVWQQMQPKSAYCTAEQVAYQNFVAGIYPPASAGYMNPYREWIGAQIRGDYFGYINPGDPETAADMAFRDACISHVKNGIYGEMWAAAMIAAAAVCDDIPTVIRAGLAQIPAGCRLAESVQRMLDGYAAGKSLDALLAEVHAQWDENNSHDWCHTISNAMIVAACLLGGEKDYAKSICAAVQTGFDTDCNGATVGSVLGMMLGMAGLPEEWTAPIHDTVDTSLCGIGKVKLTELAALTLKHAKAK